MGETAEMYLSMWEQALTKYDHWGYQNLYDHVDFSVLDWITVPLLPVSPSCPCRSQILQKAYSRGVHL